MSQVSSLKVPSFKFTYPSSEYYLFSRIVVLLTPSGAKAVFCGRDNPKYIAVVYRPKYKVYTVFLLEYPSLKPILRIVRYSYSNIAEVEAYVNGEKKTIDFSRVKRVMYDDEVYAWLSSKYGVEVSEIDGAVALVLSAVKNNHIDIPITVEEAKYAITVSISKANNKYVIGVSGETYDIRRILKKNGFVWKSLKKMWIQEVKDIDEVNKILKKLSESKHIIIEKINADEDIKKQIKIESIDDMPERALKKILELVEKIPDEVLEKLGYNKKAVEIWIKLVREKYL